MERTSQRWAAHSGVNIVRGWRNVTGRGVIHETMNDKKLQDLIENNQLDDLGVYWLEILDRGEFDLQDLLDCAKQLGRRHEKQRAAVLMNLLNEHLREHQRWSDRLRILKEITRHTLDPKKFDDVKDQFRETLSHVYFATAFL